MKEPLEKRIAEVEANIAARMAEKVSPAPGNRNPKPKTRHPTPEAPSAEPGTLK